MATKKDGDSSMQQSRAPEITNAEIGALVVPAIKVKGAQLDLKVAGDVSDETLKEILGFVRDAKGRTRIDLTIDLFGQPADFPNRVVTFLDHLHDESTQVTIAARSGSPPSAPVPPPKPPKKRKPGKKKPG